MVGGRGRWRGRRGVRLALAAALVVAAPFVDGWRGADATTTEVLTVVRDLPSGHVVTETDIAPAGFPGGSVPDGAVTAISRAVGTRLAGPVRRGELLTDAGLVGRPGDARTRGSHRVVPVPLADPSVADHLTIGDVVDLVPPAGSSPPDGVDEAVPVARAVEVVELPAGRAGGPRSILVEVPERDAARLAATAAGVPLAVLVHG